MMRVRALPIDGYRNRPIPNLLHEAPERSGHIVLFFPDLRYPTSAPLFHYLRLLYLGSGADVLTIDYDYSKSTRYLKLPDSERQHWFLADVIAAYCAAILFRPSTRLTLVGKSIGTLALADLALSGKLPEHAELVWITPPLDSESLFTTLKACRYRSLVLLAARVKAAEGVRASELTDALPRNSNIELCVFERANEELEVPEARTASSVELIKSAVGIVERFSIERAPYWSDQRKS